MTDQEKTIQALRAELEAVKYENTKLNSVVCQTCYGAGSVCSAPDDCYDCPECEAGINKIKADAILSVLDTPYDCETPNGDIAWSSGSLELISKFHLQNN